MVSALFYAVAVIAFLLAAWQARPTRRRATRVPLIVIMTALGAAFAVLAPASQAVESTIWPSLGRLLSNVCTLVAAFGVTLLVLALTGRATDTRRQTLVRLVPLAVALGVLVVAFFLSRTPQGLGIFTGLYRSQPALVVYTLTYSAYLGAAVLDMGWVAARTLRHTGGALRVGLGLISLGSVLALAYLGEKVVGVLGEVLTGRIAEGFCPGPLSTVGCTFSVAMPALSVLAIVLGFTVPAIVPAVVGLRRRRDYRRLEPLWQALVEQLPEISFVEQPPADLGFRLYRRVIEIRDGILILRPRLDVDTGRSTPEDEAAALARALRRHREEPAPPAGRARSTETSAPAPSDLDSEITRLCRVATAFTRLPPGS